MSRVRTLPRQRPEPRPPDGTTGNNQQMQWEPVDGPPELGERQLHAAQLLRTQARSVLSWLVHCCLSARASPGWKNCFSFIHPFIEDLASSPVSNQWNSWNERISSQKFYGVHELRIEISRVINQSLIYILHQYLFREVERTGFLFCLPSQYPSNYLSLGNQRCRWGDLRTAPFTVTQEGVLPPGRVT